MGDEVGRKRFVEMVRKACRIGKQLHESGVRNGSVARIDSAASIEDWAKDPISNTRTNANTFRQACDVAEDNGDRLAAEGEICWGGMHSWAGHGRPFAAGRPAENIGLPGRHGAHFALHARLQCS